MKISVDLVANTGQFQTDMGRASKAAEKRAKEIEKAFVNAGKVIGAGIAVGVTALGVMVKKALDTADEFSKLAQKTGITTEALSQLQYAAGLSGVEDLSGSLTKFNRSIAEAAQGTKAQADAFAALGVNIKNADGKVKSTEQLFNEVAEAFSKVQDGANKTAVAMDLFGKSGANLIPLLNSGAEGIRQLRDEADALGLTIDERTGKAAENFNDNLARMSAATQGIATRLAVEFAPELDRITGLLVDTAKETDSVSRASDGLASVFRGVAFAAIVLANAVQIAVKSLVGLITVQTQFFSGNFSGAISAGQAALEDVSDDVDDVRQAYGRLFGEIEKGQAKTSSPDKRGTINLPGAGDDAAAKAAKKAAADAQKEAEKALQAALDAEEKQRESIASIIDALKEEAAVMNATTGQIQARAVAKLGGTRQEQEQAKALGDYVDQLKKADAADKERAAIIEANLTPLQVYVAEIKRLNELFDNGKRDSESYNRAVAGAQKSFDEATKKAKESTDKMSVFAEQAARNMQDAFADFLFDPFKDGLEGLVKNFANALQRMAAEAAAAQIFEGLGFGQGQTGGGGGLDLLKGIFGSVVGAFAGGGTSSSGVVTRDAGGSAMAGQPVMIGKGAQPELFIPDTAGQFYPKGQWGGGETNINVYQTIQAPQGTVSKSTLMQTGAAAARGAARASARNN